MGSLTVKCPRSFCIWDQEKPRLLVTQYNTAAHSDSTHFPRALILLVSSHLHKYEYKKKGKEKIKPKPKPKPKPKWTRPVRPHSLGGNWGRGRLTLLYLLLITLGTNRRRQSTQLELSMGAAFDGNPSMARNKSSAFSVTFPFNHFVA